MPVNLEKMSLDELKKLARDVEKAISGFKDRQRKDALKAMEKAAKEFGLTVEEVVGGKAPRKTRSAGAAKFRNPADPKQTWTGKGRQPAWYKDAMAAGKSPKDLAI